LKPLKKLLIDEGYDAITTESGEEALSIIESEQIALVLFDDEVSRGQKIWKKILSRHKNLPVIILTRDDSVCPEARKAGALECFELPVDLSRLIIMMYKALDKQSFSKGGDKTC
jgi:DNA-binding NtrC family response regulator